MPPETEESESELQAIGIVIQSGKLSTEEVGFGLREFEPTPHLEANQIGGEEPPRSPPPSPCPCCPQYAHFQISGSITISGTYSFIPGWTRTFGGGETLPFTGVLDPGPGGGQYSGGFNTDCECSGEPPCDGCNNESDPDPDCPARYGPDCVYDRCVPSEPGSPFRCCSNLACQIRLRCVTTTDFEGPGWYLTVFTGSSDTCGGQFSWSTDYAGLNLPPSYIKLTNNCHTLPTGHWPIDLDSPPGYVFGPAHIDLDIAEPLGACCQSYGVCEEVGESECMGTWHCAGNTCNENNFTTDAEFGACCFAGFPCIDGYRRANCEVGGGIWKGVCTDCAHEICV